MNWRRSMIGLGVALPLIGLLGFGLTRDPTTIDSPLPGKPAPDFDLARMTGGGSLNLSQLRGKVVIVNFWASWCIPCRSEHPLLSMAHRRWAPEGVQFIGIVYNDTPDNARAWLQEMGGEEWPTLLDPGGRTAIEFGVYGVPETFIIDPDGIVVHKQLSVITPEVVAQFVEPLLTARNSQ
jgi:cytochrome c biogenesis protein CcmG, thiol:disulfide interchange protein DsbE